MINFVVKYKWLGMQQSVSKNERTCLTAPQLPDAAVSFQNKAPLPPGITWMHLTDECQAKSFKARSDLHRKVRTNNMRKILIKGTIIAALGALSITMAACGAKPESNKSTSKTESSTVTRESGARQKSEMQNDDKDFNEMQNGGSENNEMQDESQEGVMSENKDNGQIEIQTDSETGNTQSSELKK